MQYPQFINIDLTNPQTISVGLRIDETLFINQQIQRPEGDPDALTLGKIKQLALQAAKSKIPQ